MRAPALRLALSFVAGLLLPATVAPAWPLSLSAVLLATAWWCTIRGRVRPGSVSVLVAFALLGYAANALRTRAVERAPLVTMFHDRGERSFTGPCFVTGRLRREPELRLDVTILTLDTEWLRVKREEIRAAGGLRASVRGELQERLRGLVRGDQVSFWAHLREPSYFHNPGGFDAEAYLARERIELFASVKSALMVDRRENAPYVPSLASRLRRAALMRISDRLGASGDVHGVVAALVTGERSQMTARVERLYRRAGIFHVMAISGAHVAIVILILHRAMRRLGLDERPSLLLLLAVLPLYAAFCGGRPPVVRASVMASIVIGARLASLDAPRTNGLSLSALLLLAWDPASRSDPGFQLTFAAMAAILWWSEPIARRLAPLGFLAAPLAVSLAAQLGVVPVAAWHFHRVTPLAPFVSIVAMPLAALVVMLGLALVLAFPVPLLSDVLTFGTRLSAGALTWIAKLASELPGASFRVGRPSLAWMALALAACVLLLGSSRRRRACGFALASCLVLAVLLPGGRRQGIFEMAVLDVGHGDAIVLSFPDGRTALVDAGGLPGSSTDVGERVVVPFLLERGVRALDAVVLTHADYDHLGGLFTILDDLRVKEVWEGSPPRDRPVYAALRRKASRRGVPFRTLTGGARFQWGGVFWEVLAAGGVEPRLASADENDRSVVLRLTYGEARLLLTGDAEAALEGALVRSRAELQADVLKLAHHGSRTSTTGPFLERVRPRLAVVSARRTSWRKIPSPRVLHRLRARGIEYLRTDEAGTITVRFHRDGRLEVRTHRGTK